MFNMKLGQAQTLQHLQTSHTQLFPQLTQLSQNRLIQCKKQNNIKYELTDVATH